MTEIYVVATTEQGAIRQLKHYVEGDYGGKVYTDIGTAFSEVEQGEKVWKLEIKAVPVSD